MGDVVRLFPHPPGARREPEPLLREVVGRRLRAARHERSQRLVDTAAAAGISPQYLSEIERGLKEASSEILAAVTGALGLRLLDLGESVVGELRTVATSDRIPGPKALAV